MLDSLFFVSVQRLISFPSINKAFSISKNLLPDRFLCHKHGYQFGHFPLYLALVVCSNVSGGLGARLK
jgi:hypothetical protein